MLRHIILFALLITTSYGYSQNSSPVLTKYSENSTSGLIKPFGISKSELINIEGAPNKVGKNALIYNYYTSPLKLDKDDTQPYGFLIKYRFNSSNELVEVQKISYFLNYNLAKNKINNLLKSAKQQYHNSSVSENTIIFDKIKYGIPGVAYGLNLVPQNYGGVEDGVKEIFMAIKYLD